MGTNEKPSLELLKRLAKEKGGECLSDTYTGVLDRYDWRCNNCGREWRSNATGLVYKGSFCKSCSLKKAWSQGENKVTTEDARALALKRGGEFLSEELVNTKDKYRWRCGCGHVWDASYDKVNQGRWCPPCGRKKVEAASTYSRAEICEIARLYGGELVDDKYLGIGVYHHFRCANGHIFRKLPSQLTKTNPLSRNWCQKCSKGLNISEAICRAVIETAYERRFFSIYPGEWLKNSRGRRMQLDGYCESLGLAFEYQGQQHFEEVGKFKNSSIDLSQRMKDDDEKRRLCKSHNITLVSIPYFKTVHLTVEKLIQHVKSAFLATGINLPAVSPIEVEKAIALEISQPMKRLRELAKYRDGEILSTTYLGMASKYRWRCSVGHEWDALASSVNHGSWCGTCAGNVPLTLAHMHALAEKRGGKCLSTEYHTTSQHLRWQCGDCGHEWDALPSNVRKGHWCPKCATERAIEKAGEELRALLSTFGYKMISEYAGSNKPLVIACPNGHESRAAQAYSLRRKFSRPELRCISCVKNSLD